MGLEGSSLISMHFICLVGVSLTFSVEELLSSKLRTRFFDRLIGNGLSSESDDGDGLGSLFSTLITDSFFGVIESFFAKNELNFIRFN